MADKKITEWYTANPITLDPGDIFPLTEDTGTTPATGAAKVGQLMRDYYKISVTVSSNDLVVALKHLDGTDPSTDRPLYFKIGGSVRAVTAALSVTKADGTSWAALGSVELGTLEQDLFVYLVWNTNLTPDAVDIFWSRKSTGRLYSDFSATTTNALYAAINSTAPAATDDCVNIGRSAATLSLTGTGHLWTVPTYTNLNLVNHPIYETRNLSWSPAYSNLSAGDGTVVTYYKRILDTVRVTYSLIWGSTTSISGSVSLSLPVPKGSIYSASSVYPIAPCRLRDSSPATSVAGLAQITTTSISIVYQTIPTAAVVQTALSSTAPFTWATGDGIEFEIRYEAS